VKYPYSLIKVLILSFNGVFLLDLSTNSLTEKFNVQKQQDSKYFGVGY